MRMMIQLLHCVGSIFFCKSYTVKYCYFEFISSSYFRLKFEWLQNTATFIGPGLVKV